MDMVILWWPMVRYCGQWVNPAGTNSKILCANWTNIMTADGLAAQGARASAAMILVMLDEQTLVFYKEEFQLTRPSQCWGMTENENMFFFMSFIINSAWPGLLLACMLPHGKSERFNYRRLWCVAGSIIKPGFISAMETQMAPLR